MKTSKPFRLRSWPSAHPTASTLLLFCTLACTRGSGDRQTAADALVSVLASQDICLSFDCLEPLPANMLSSAPDLALVLQSEQRRRSLPCAPVSGRASPEAGSGMCTGNIRTDIAIPNIGTFVYNSNASATDRGYGQGFDFASDRHIELTSGGFQLVDGDGTRISLIRNSDSGPGNIFRAADFRFNQSLFGISPSFAIEKTHDGSLFYYRLSEGQQIPAYHVYFSQDRYENRVVFTRGSRGELTEVSFLAGTIRFLYGSDRRLVAVKDIAGNRYEVETTSSQSGNVLSRVKLPDGQNLWQISYDSQSSRISGITDPGGTTTQRVYDSKGNLSRVTFERGGELQYDYTPSKVKVSSGDSVLAEEEFVDNRVISLTSHGKKTTFSYDSLGQNTQVNYPDNTSKRYQYLCGGAETCRPFDPRLHLVTQSLRINGVLRSSQSYTYDCQTDDNICDLTRHVDEGGVVTAIKYNSNLPWHLRESVTKNDLTTSFSYDDKGNVVRTTTPYGSMTSSFNDDGTMASHTDIYGMTTRWKYKKGQVVEKTDHFGIQTTYGYDNLGILSRIASPTGSWQGLFDIAGRAISAETTRHGNLTAGNQVSSRYSRETGKLLSSTYRSTTGSATVVINLPVDPAGPTTLSTPVVENLIIRDSSGNKVIPANPVPGEG